MTLFQQLRKGFFVLIFYCLVDFQNVSVQHLELLGERLFVFEKKLAPQLGVNVRNARNIAVASRGKANVIRAARAEHVGAGEHVRDL